MEFRCLLLIIIGISRAPGCSSKSAANKPFSLKYTVQAESVKIRHFVGMTNEASQVSGISLSTNGNCWNSSRALALSTKFDANKSVLKSCTFRPGFSFTSMKTFEIWNPNQNKYEPKPVSYCAESGGPTGDEIPGQVRLSRQLYKDCALE